MSISIVLVTIDGSKAGSKGLHRQLSYGHASIQWAGGAMSFTQSALVQFSSAVQLGHIAAMHRVSVQGMQRSQAVTMSTAVGEHRPQ